VQVLLPISPDIEVSEELFQRTPADLKQEYLRARQRLEQNEVLMTRAMREKLKNKNVKQYSIARVRVRFPEGLILQGMPGSYKALHR
jgi:UBX domain-containing protein 6